MRRIGRIDKIRIARMKFLQSFWTHLLYVCDGSIDNQKDLCAVRNEMRIMVLREFGLERGFMPIGDEEFENQCNRVSKTPTHIRKMTYWYTASLNKNWSMPIRKIVCETYKAFYEKWEDTSWIRKGVKETDREAKRQCFVRIMGFYKQYNRSPDVQEEILLLTKDMGIFHKDEALKVVCEDLREGNIIADGRSMPKREFATQCLPGNIKLCELVLREECVPLKSLYGWRDQLKKLPIGVW